jgi:hypothetical protein
MGGVDASKGDFVSPGGRRGLVIVIVILILIVLEAGGRTGKAASLAPAAWPVAGSARDYDYD